jgi:hypothetical protein
MVKGLVLGLLLAIQISFIVISVTTFGDDSPLIILPFLGVAGVIFLLFWDGVE